ncbi:hypothetical protein ABN254_21355, partial [Providencia rettgeri]
YFIKKFMNIMVEKGFGGHKDYLIFLKMLLTSSRRSLFHFLWFFTVSFHKHFYLPKGFSNVVQVRAKFGRKQS